LADADMEDLVSDVVSAVWVKRKSLDCPERYIRRACRNRLIRFLARKRRRMHVQGEWLLDRATPGTAVSRFPESPSNGNPSRQAKLTLISESVARADGLVRLILHLRHEAGLTWSDVSELTGMTAPSARMRELRFRRQVRRAWERSGAEQDVSSRSAIGKSGV